MITYGVRQIAEMTEYTERQIRHECAKGRLKAVRFLGRDGWQIGKADYLTWLANPPAQRRRWRGKRGMRK